MLLRKTLSLLGIGSAQVDLILEKGTYALGEIVSGYFLLKGGTVEQDIKRIDCELIKLDCLTNKENIIDTVTILSSRTIEVEHQSTLPSTMKLPIDIESSNKSIVYYFKTKLVFDEGVESKDQDIIYVTSGSHTNDHLI